jgi:transcription initiation factor IIE alpha subunit
MRSQNPYYYCNECGCWITTGPMTPGEAHHWLKQRCPDCDEPLSETIVCSQAPPQVHIPVEELERWRE